MAATSSGPVIRRSEMRLRYCCSIVFVGDSDLGGPVADDTFHAGTLDNAGQDGVDPDAAGRAPWRGSG